MNIKNVKEVDKVDNVEQSIFEKQLSLVVKYKDIEKLPKWPLNLNLYKHQVIIKDFKQRGMEEIAEAYEAFLKDDMEHFKEELIDALHFFVELNILVGKDYDFFNKFNKHGDCRSINTTNLLAQIGKVTVEYGLMCNFLKNKPWKQTQMQTDEAKFYEQLKHAFGTFQDLLAYIGMSSKEIYNYYFKKNKVNEFRIKSKY